MLIILTIFAFCCTLSASSQPLPRLSTNSCTRKLLDQERSIYICSTKLQALVEPLLFLNLKQKPDINFDFILQSYHFSYRVILQSPQLLKVIKSKNSDIRGRIGFYQVEKIRFYFSFPVKGKVSVFSNWTRVEEAAEVANLTFNAETEADAVIFIQELRKSPSLLQKHLRVDCVLKKSNKDVKVIERKGRILYPFSQDDEESVEEGRSYFKILQDTNRRKLFIRYSGRSSFIIQPLLWLNPLAEASIIYDKKRKIYRLAYEVLLKSPEALLKAQGHLSDVKKGRLPVVFQNASRIKIFFNSSLFKDVFLAENWSQDAAALKKNLVNISFGCRLIESCESFHSFVFAQPERFQEVVTVDIKTSKPSNSEERGLKLWPALGKRFVLVQQRIDGALKFNKNWQLYKNGFGSKDSSFWVGLRHLHFLTSNAVCPPQLRVEMESFSNEVFWAEYKFIAVSDESEGFRLALIGYNQASSAGDSMMYNSGQEFSTTDHIKSSNKRCPQTFGSSGWWFGSCSNANPNGIWYSTRKSTSHAIHWSSLDGTYSLKSIRMLLVYK